MENNLNDIFKLEVTPKLKEDLRTAATWGKIVGLMAFISSGISLIGSFRQGMGPVVASIISAAISVFIYLYVFKFGNDVKKAIESNDQVTMNEGLRNLSTYFKILGVLMIIGIAICVLAIVFVGLGAMMKS